MLYRPFKSILFFLLFFLPFFLCSTQIHAIDKPLVTEEFANNACIECHIKNQPHLIDNWRNSSHALSQPVINCISCHGKSHVNAASMARQNSACTNCHGGKKSPVVHSYSTSKHGIIMQLEQNSYNWNQPLYIKYGELNYRSPGCAYCHMYRGNHNVSSMVRSDLMANPTSDNIKTATRSVCQDCHAPRYISQLLYNGEQMLEIGRKKLRESAKLISQASVNFSDNELAPAREILETARQHLKNIYLGAAHQSADYQWWHGQPALDGDLLRIKGIISELHRKKNSKNAVKL